MAVKRPLLLPLVPLYRAAIGIRNGWYDSGDRTQALRGPVVSVGSIAAGGAGKTPFLIALARLLQCHGYAPDVLSRGYGRSSRGALRVNPAGSAREFGDEPLMLAQTLKVPVYVGSSRLAAGRLAEAEPESAASAACVHLLDDGFSHRALRRALDIALLTLEDAHDTPLPGGNLREPLHALRRAGVLVLRAEEAGELTGLVRKIVRPRTPIWTVTRQMILPPEVPRHPVVFSAIARPLNFEAMVRAANVAIAGVRQYKDHHACTPAEIEALCTYARSRHADGFLTTAKDAVKLTETMLAALQQVGPVAVAEMTVKFEAPEAVWSDLEAALRQNANLS